MSKIYESEDEIIVVADGSEKEVIKRFVAELEEPITEKKRAFEAGYIKGYREGYIAAQTVYSKEDNI